jgi:hypothetical protein
MNSDYSTSELLASKRHFLRKLRTWIALHLMKRARQLAMLIAPWIESN